MVTWATIWLTLVTLVACEIIPKALAVSQAESVARFMVPIINLLAIAVFPIGKLMQVSQHMLPSADADCLSASPAGDMRCDVDSERATLLACETASTCHLPALAGDMWCDVDALTCAVARDMASHAVCCAR
jgi:hypothetical protein